jgi:hypothetical protein
MEISTITMVSAGFIWKAISAKWEPPHGRFQHFYYPWSEYVKVGAVLRYCAYEVMALHGVLHSEIQVFSFLAFLCLCLCVCIQWATSLLLVKVCTHIFSDGIFTFLFSNCVQICLQQGNLPKLTFVRFLYDTRILNRTMNQVTKKNNKKHLFFRLAPLRADGIRIWLAER